MTSTDTKPQTFFPVALALLKPGTLLPCEIWLKHATGQPVLYRARNMAFADKHRQKLLDAGVETVLIPFDDARGWTLYLEEGLCDRMQDRSQPVETRAQLLVGAARPLLKDVLANPYSPDVKPRVSALSDSICELLVQPDAVAATVRLMEHDYYTYTHSLHVSIYAVALARAAGVDATDVLAAIGRGALMHDCGKCLLPAGILNKPGRLSGDEWEMMQRHPQLGAEVLQETRWDDDLVASVCLCHHERLDGSGYPHGWVGQRVPLAARITAIVDAYDAMTTDRSYQQAMRGAEALSIIRTRGREAYDQTLVETFIRVLREPQQF